MARKTKEEAEKTRTEIIDAARKVFHEHGVTRSTLEKIAQAAGVTRGAVYWHFKDKAALFFAMREDMFRPMLERTDAVLFSPAFANPLDAIEASLKEFFIVLDDSPSIRQVFEIFISRCEYVDEFSTIQEEVGRPASEFLIKIEKMYQRAADCGALLPTLSTHAYARDTWAFTSGLLHLMFGCRRGTGLESDIPLMIENHMKLRRKVIS